MNRWAEVPGYRDYEVSDQGVVRVVALRDQPLPQPSELKPSVHDGYHRVALLRPHRRNVFVHVLVLEAFIGPCPPGQETRHIDGNRTNNHLTNLTWGTDPENAADRDAHGTTARGERAGLAKLTADDVRQIRLSPASQRELAAYYGVSRRAIRQILDHSTWRHIT